MASTFIRMTKFYRCTLRRAFATVPPPVSKDKLMQQAKILNLLKENLKADEQNEFVVPVFKRSLLYAEQTAIKDPTGEYSYLQLYMSAKKLAIQISNICGSGACSTVAFLCENNILSVMSQFACWMSGQVAVPLKTNYSVEKLKYLVADSKAKLIISPPEYECASENIASELELPLLVIDHNFLPAAEKLTNAIERLLITGNSDSVLIAGTLNNEFYTNSNALLLYTSGTIGKPKGVMLTHKNLNAQIKCLVDGWQYQATDSLLHVLPLNHIPGCINALLCPLSVGGKIIMQDRFNSHSVWGTMLAINAPEKDRVNILMAEPIIYHLLIAEYDKIFAKNSRMVEYIENFCRKNFRLMVCCSGPLPEVVFDRWREITGHSLLERYGTTETGIVLSNPYNEEKSSGRVRFAGTVGMPLPEVNMRLVDADDKVLMDFKGETGKGFWVNDNTTPAEAAVKEDSNQETQQISTDDTCTSIVGELQVAGPMVFKEYINQPEETQSSFLDGYFRTGDMAAYENGSFKILGRANLDIITTGGKKVSGLEIEALLFTHPDIDDVAVLGIPDKTLGERVGVVCVVRPKSELSLESIKLYCSQILPEYMHPSELKIVDELPRINMVQIDKKQLLEMCLKDEQRQVASNPLPFPII